jgi:hypothetical protein
MQRPPLIQVTLERASDSPLPSGERENFGTDVAP